MAENRRLDSDTVIIGCIHYPLNKDIIGDFMPKVSSVGVGKEAAIRLKNLLDNYHLGQNTVDREKDIAFPKKRCLLRRLVKGSSAKNRRND